MVFVQDIFVVPLSYALGCLSFSSWEVVAIEMVIIKS